MDHEAMRAAYLRALEQLRPLEWLLSEPKPVAVTPPETAERQLRSMLGRPSWGSE